MNTLHEILLFTALFGSFLAWGAWEDRSIKRKALFHKTIWKVMEQSGNWDYLRANPFEFEAGAFEKVKQRHNDYLDAFHFATNTVFNRSFQSSYLTMDNQG